MLGGGQIRNIDGCTDVVGGIGVLAAETGAGSPELSGAAGTVSTPGARNSIGLIGPDISQGKADVVAGKGHDGPGVHDHPVDCRC